MIKSELITALGEENPHLTQRDIERVVGIILERMIQALEAGGRVELRGFGAFSVRSRPAREGRNPRTGAAVSMPLEWSAVKKGLDPKRFTVRTAPALLKKSAAWKDYARGERPLLPVLKKLAG